MTIGLSALEKMHSRETICNHPRVREKKKTKLKKRDLEIRTTRTNEYLF